MKLRQDDLKNKVVQDILSWNKTLLTAEQVYDALVDPPNPELGDLAFGCFLFAKDLKKSPAQVAHDIKEALKTNSHFADVQAAGPYVNFKFKLSLLGELTIQAALDKKLFQKKLTQNAPKTMIEFSQPNTHKELHVGHMRNLCLGDALIKLHRYCSYPIISSTFPGDVGTHVAKCLWYLKFHNKEAVPQTNKGEWIGRIYSLANLKLEDEESTDLGPKNKEQLTLILKQLEAKSGEYFELWKETRQWSIELMQKTYEWAGVSFDKWYWESDVDSASVQYVKQLYSDGKLIESQGAIGMDLEQDKLGFCLLLKGDGTGLYATKDLELARRKFQDFHIEKSVYVVDQRQELHFKQVFKVLEKLGFEQAKNCFHLKYNFVELPDGAMSSRKGNIVPITKLIQNMKQTIIDNYLSRYKNDPQSGWTDQDIDLISDQVAQGAIKYGMLKMDTNKKIVFDMNEWLKLDGDSGPFIQYSYARIKSILRKFQIKEQNYNWNLLTHKTERALIQSMMHFNHVAQLACESYKPASMCNYLYDLAKRFNQFYHDCPIGTAENEDLKQARLALAKAIAHTFETGLTLLGIPAPQKM